MSLLHHTIASLKELPLQEKRMPVLFVGHGSPMNAIDDNEFSLYWEKLGAYLPKPKAILVISAHWLTKGTQVTSGLIQSTIHDFRGFPQTLFDVDYSPEGDPKLVHDIQSMITSTAVEESEQWGLDHGSWSVLRRMFPLADIPTVQLSIDYYKQGDYHYHLGRELQTLRDRGVLIVGSGNIVHNLRMVDWGQMGVDNYGFDWAIESNELIKQYVMSRDFNPLKNYLHLGTAVQYAVPTPDHYYPLLYILGATSAKDQLHIFNDKYVGGSLSMSSYLFG